MNTNATTQTVTAGRAGHADRTFRITLVANNMHEIEAAEAAVTAQVGTEDYNLIWNDDERKTNAKAFKVVEVQ